MSFRISFIVLSLTALICCALELTNLATMPVWIALADASGHEINCTGYQRQRFIAGNWLSFITCADGSSRLHPLEPLHYIATQPCEIAGAFLSRTARARPLVVEDFRDGCCGITSGAVVLSPGDTLDVWANLRPQRLWLFVKRQAQ